MAILTHRLRPRSIFAPLLMLSLVGLFLAIGNAAAQRTTAQAQVEPGATLHQAAKPQLGKDEAQAQRFSLDEPHPTIKFEEVNFDFGATNQNESLTHEFKFKNVGKADLTVENVRGG